MLALAETPRARRSVAWAAALSLALHGGAAAWLAVRAPGPERAERAPLAIALLREPATEPAPAAAPAPPAPTPARVAPRPPAPVAKPPPVRRVAARPAPKREPVAAPRAPVAAPSPAPAGARHAARAATGSGEAGAAVSAAPGPASGRAAAGVDPVSAYVASLLRRIESEKRYPALARSRGVEGTVVVTLWISPAGALDRIEVGGKASPLLVSSTRDAVERASPFPPPPDGMPPVRVPIRYALR